MFTSFIPRDVVQQYVSSYGGPFFPKNSEHGHGVEYVQPPWAMNHPPPPYPPTYPILPHDVFIDPPYLPPPVDHSLTRTGGPFQIIKDLCPLSRLIAGYYDLGAEFLITACSFVLLGSALTTLLCNFTTFCTLPFFPLFRRYAPEKNDRIDSAEHALNKAIEKFESNQQSVSVDKKPGSSNTI